MARVKALPTDLAAAVRHLEMASATSVLRVDVTGDVGYLYFSKGELVHAVTLELDGALAAVEMAGWSETSLSLCERRWPRERNITRSFAQLLDDARAAAAEIVERLVEQRRHDTVPSTEDAAQPEQVAPDVDNLLHFPSALGLRQSLARADLRNGLRMKAGRVIDTQGSSDHLPPILLSTLALGDSLGVVLGLGPLLAAEATAPTLHRVLARSTDDTSIVEAASSNAVQLARAFLKLG